MEISQIVLLLATLTVLEIILGIDNLVFISVACCHLEPAKRYFAGRVGLSLALIGRILLLFMISWVIKFNNPLLYIFSKAFSGKDIFLIFGGLFLLIKATWEIHNEVEHKQTQVKNNASASKFLSVIVQIIVFDIVFSLDSILTAVGLTTHLWIMVIAIIIAIIIMMAASKVLSQFINQNPSIKMLALSFLLLIGTLLIADGFGYIIPKGYIYFAIAFSLLCESLSILRRKRHDKLKN